MAVKKLTLSAPEEVIAEAKRIAKRKKTSVSALFARLLKASDVELAPGVMLGPITQRATGIVRLPKGRSDAELLADALDEKYGRAR